jgi:predicted ribonuclease YlaK
MAPADPHLWYAQQPYSKGESKRGKDLILAVAHHLKREANASVVLVTKDLNLRIKADVLGIAAEDFSNDKVDFCSLYSGFRDLYVTAEELTAFYRNGVLPLDNHPAPFPHEFLVLKNLENPSQSALGRYTGAGVSPIMKDSTTHWGIRARNKEQRFAMDLLMDDAVPVVTLLGKAGTGKTLLALAVALEKVLEEKAYSRVLVTRPVIPVGDDLGYLPGNKEEKLRPWMQPIYDNLDNERRAFRGGGAGRPIALIALAFFRQAEGKRGPFSHAAFHPYFAAVSLDDMFDDGKAQSRASHIARAVFVDSVEALEDPV